MDKHRDPKQDLIDEFEPSAMPPPGVMSMTRPAPLAPAPPRLCALGPCRHYHRMEIQLDAEEPKDGTPGLVHVRVHHACYPEVGIDTDMTDVPVFACNRWDPIDADEEWRRDKRRTLTLATPEGDAFRRDLEAWEAMRLERAALNEVSDAPTPTPGDAPSTEDADKANT